MNKKKFARVLSMYRDGVNERVCIESIMDLSSSHTQAAAWIGKFYYETLLKNTLTYCTERKKYVELLSPKEPPNVEDN